VFLTHIYIWANFLSRLGLAEAWATGQQLDGYYQPSSCWFNTVTSALAVARRSGQFVCHSVCEQDYRQSNEPISLKLDVMIGPTNRKNRLTVDGNPVPATDSGSLFHFPRHCGIADFRRLLAFMDSHCMVHFHDTRRNDWHRQIMNPQYFW